MLTRNRTNPLFDADAFRLIVGEERADRALHDQDSVDLLMWNVFSTLETHNDPAWLAGRLQQLAGPALREPVRIALFTGAEREPRLDPPASYVASVRQRAQSAGAQDAEVSEFAAPVEVPARIESPEVVALVEATIDEIHVGHGGRERVVEVIDVGLETARRTGKNLTVCVVYRSGTGAASELSARINALRTSSVLAAALPHRRTVPAVTLRELSWQQLLRTWQTELPYLDVDGLPVKQFLAHCRNRGLL